MLEKPQSIVMLQLEEIAEESEFYSSLDVAHQGKMRQFVMTNIEKQMCVQSQTTTTTNTNNNLHTSYQVIPY